jgi:hypothetical protein
MPRATEVNRGNQSDADEWRDSPSAWFSLLESSVNRGDFESAAAAQSELARLGVNVRFGRAGRRETTTSGSP